MIGEPALRGYLLEEALAWLLRNSGYRLLTADDQDRQLVTNGNTLRVQGRGAQHQVDVLGQFALTPAFSLPIRMFIEAKFRRQKSDLADVRNAHGVVHDINENFVSIGNSRTPAPLLLRIRAVLHQWIHGGGTGIRASTTDFSRRPLGALVRVAPDSRSYNGKEVTPVGCPTTLGVLPHRRLPPKLEGAFGNSSGTSACLIPTQCGEGIASSVRQP